MAESADVLKMDAEYFPVCGFLPVGFSVTGCRIDRHIVVQQFCISYRLFCIERDTETVAGIHSELDFRRIDQVTQRLLDELVVTV